MGSNQVHPVGTEMHASSAVTIQRYSTTLNDFIRHVNLGFQLRTEANSSPTCSHPAPPFSCSFSDGKYPHSLSYHWVRSLQAEDVPGFGMAPSFLLTLRPLAPSLSPPDNVTYSLDLHFLKTPVIFILKPKWKALCSPDLLSQGSPDLFVRLLLGSFTYEILGVLNNTLLTSGLLQPWLALGLEVVSSQSAVMTF